MDFVSLATRVCSFSSEELNNEAITKSASVIPFLRLLGYDDSDPRYFRSEYIADVRDNNERVDYAILDESRNPIMIVEVKTAGLALNLTHVQQLRNYFLATPARIGILTNGLIYQFYSDLDVERQMDTEPFLTINFGDIVRGNTDAIAELNNFHKESFDVPNVINHIKNTQMKDKVNSFVNNLFANPSEDFLNMLIKECDGGRATISRRDAMSEIWKDVASGYMGWDSTEELIIPEPVEVEEFAPEPVVTAVWQEPSDVTVGKTKKIRLQRNTMLRDVNTDEVKSVGRWMVNTITESDMATKHYALSAVGYWRRKYFDKSDRFTLA